MEPIKALKCDDEDKVTSMMATDVGDEMSPTSMSPEGKPVLNSYTFVIPEEKLGIFGTEEKWFSLFPQFNVLESGQSLTFSGSCNPNFEFYHRNMHYSCENAVSRPKLCTNPVHMFVAWAINNTNGHLETYLQCPQCGCGAEGAANLNDLYAAEQSGSRKVSDGEPLINDFDFDFDF